MVWEHSAPGCRRRGLEVALEARACRPLMARASTAISLTCVIAESTSGWRTAPEAVSPTSPSQINECALPTRRITSERSCRPRSHRAAYQSTVTMCRSGGLCASPNLLDTPRFEDRYPARDRIVLHRDTRAVVRWRRCSKLSVSPAPMCLPGAGRTGRMNPCSSTVRSSRRLP